MTLRETASPGKAPDATPDATPDDRADDRAGGGERDGTTGDRHAGGRGVRALRCLPAYLPVLLIAAGGWAHRWSTEDAFINYRILDNLFAGHGPVFNAGERVEAGTSPLWLGVLAVGRAAAGWFASIEWIAVVLCLLAAIGAFALAGSAARTIAADGRATVVPIGPLAVSSVAVVWDWATSGLEMSFVWLWIAACWYVLVRVARDGEPSRRGRLAGAALIGLAPLIRPDLGIMMICFAIAWYRLVRPRRLATDLAAMLALPVAYQIFRMGYFASLVPSTALAKDAGGLHLAQGWNYLADLVRPYRLWVPLAVVGVVIVARLRTERDTRQATATVAVVAAALGHAGYVTTVGGDYMHGRLLLPALFAVALPAVVVVRDRSVVRLGACAVTGAWVVMAFAWWRPPVPYGGIPEVADWRQITGTEIVPAAGELWLTGHDRSAIHDEGVRGYFRVLESEPLPGRDPDALVITLGSIGIQGYQLGTDVWVIDRGGLAEPLASRTDPVPGRQAGHRKEVDPAWYDARFGVVDGDPDAAAAARALECGPVDDLLDAVTDDLTPGRFLSNLWHSPEYTRLHIPADPTEAAERFCG